MTPKNFSRYKLKNGITVLHEKRDLPIVSLSITNPFGASHETSEIKGIAHFIEHLLFTGTKKRTHEDISREIEKKGGILNAFTTNDVTSYWFKLPSQHIFTGLDILTDMLNNSTMEKEKFEKEKKVIIEEIKMHRDSPQSSVFDRIQSNLYEKPFGEGVIGSEKTILAMKRDFVFEYFNKAYSPENFIVTIVGKAPIEKVCKYLEENFSPKGTKTIPLKINLKNSKTTETREGIDQAQFIFAIHAPNGKDKKLTHLEILNAYLANGMSSRLFLEIREKRGLAYEVKGALNTEKNYSYYQIYVGTTKEALPEVEKIILEEFKKVKNMTEKDLSEAKQLLIGQKEISLEESISVMNELVFAEIITEKAENYYAQEKEILSATLSDVKKMADFSSYSTATIRPK